MFYSAFLILEFCFKAWLQVITYLYQLYYKMSVILKNFDKIPKTKCKKGVVNKFII